MALNIQTSIRTRDTRPSKTIQSIKISKTPSNTCTMDSSGLLQIPLILVTCFIIFHFACKSRSNRKIPRSWPVLGMTPSLIVNTHRVYDWTIEVLQEAGLTFLFKGPCLARMDMLVTVDPANIHYILSSNFTDFPKGPEFKKIFEVLGDGIFNADSELWKGLRRSAHALMSSRGFHEFLAKTGQRKIEGGLLRILDHAAKTNSVVDLQDLFQRFTFDTTFILVSGFDPGCLSLDFPEIEFAKALDDAEEAIFYRHVKPEMLWRIQRWLGVGDEKKLITACETLDRVLAGYLSLKRQELRESKDVSSRESVDLLTHYILMTNQEKATAYGLATDTNSDKFLRDAMLNLMLAGRDTTSSALSWFFWLISKHREILSKIREEIDSKLQNQEDPRVLFGPHEMNKLVYLQGALREALRLYPPVPFQHKYASKPTTLPSGHLVDEHKKILFSLYALGRMRSVWGEDAEEFKPERWISERGEIRHEPSYKFLAFNAGPRTCLGRQIALAQMTAVAVAVLRSYDVVTVEGEKVEPRVSIILHMKHGLRVRITKKSD